ESSSTPIRGCRAGTTLAALPPAVLACDHPRSLAAVLGGALPASPQLDERSSRPSRTGVPEPVFVGADVDKGPESVENRRAVWTSGPAGTGESPARRGPAGARIHLGLGPIVTCPPRRPRADHESALDVHRPASLVHAAAPHRHEASSTASTP